MYLKEWLDYHTFIGVEKFFIYDNAESFEIDHYGKKDTMPTKNKYGYDYLLDIKQAREIQQEIIKDYDVELVEWSPRDTDGKVLYNQVESMNHLASKKSSGLVAFIDVDEFIIKKEDFRESRMLQVKYENRHDYESVLNISMGFDELKIPSYATKCIVDMSRYPFPVDPHFNRIDFPISESYFNHYNHNTASHEWLLKNYIYIDSTWKPKSYSEILKIMPTLSEITGFKG
jgi:hypothetical protein